MVYKDGRAGPRSILSDGIRRDIQSIERFFSFQASRIPPVPSPHLPLSRSCFVLIRYDLYMSFYHLARSTLIY